MKMHSAEAIAIATVMLTGGSAARFHTSGFGVFLPNQIKYGTFKPVWRNVPADARSSRNPTQYLCSSNPAATIMDLLTKPLNNGNAEMDRPPIKVKTKVHGIF